MWDRAIRDFIHYLRFEKKYSPHTQSAYQKDLEQFVDFVSPSQAPTEKELQIPPAYLIRSWMASLKESGMAPTSINRKIAAVRSFFNFILADNPGEQNTAKAVFLMKSPKRLPVFLKEAEIAKALDRTSAPDDDTRLLEGLLISLLYETGMRRSEIIQLRCPDIDWSRSLIRVRGKGNKERDIPISSHQLEQIHLYLSKRPEAKRTEFKDRLFILPSGRPIYAQFLYRLVKSCLSRVTTLEKRSPHVLRHSFATHLLQKGANIQAIKDLLGHSSLAATQIYTYNQIEQLKNIHKENHPRG